MINDWPLLGVAGVVAGLALRYDPTRGGVTAKPVRGRAAGARLARRGAAWIADRTRLRIAANLHAPVRLPGRCDPHPVIRAPRPTTRARRVAGRLLMAAPGFG